MDIEQIRIAFHKGDQRTSRMKVWLNGSPYTLIESSGETLDFEDFLLEAKGVKKVMLEALGMPGDGWISITEVRAGDVFAFFVCHTSISERKNANTCIMCACMWVHACWLELNPSTLENKKGFYS